ncbi:type III secretion system outer membrane ring subunit SctC [Thalassomonas viridans]|uniref:Type 3 secretion system secretin n=1 Tax=Thalassomonas viridans TaxID=137584 RepID=A0AAF0C505_9GAMM|nr:type III secretion system outer membrane ring subunit SctC [Thalassomonas viridans]WDE02802.1 type III secretion system outer membrane ring subunit SctC [Thalassomonas viridans]
MTFLRYSLLLLCFFSQQALSSQPDWKGQKYGYMASGETLKEILREFASSYGIPANVSDSLDMPINGNFPENTAENILKQLSAISNMTWYYDGHMLHFYRTDESESAVVQLKYISTQELYQTMRVLPWWQLNAQWTALEQQKLIFVAGAPKFVEMVVKVAEMLDKEVRKQHEDKFVISTFRLQYASAIDYTYSYRGQEKQVPGVLSLLTDTLSGSQSGQVTRVKKPQPSLQGRLPVKPVKTGAAAQDGGQSSAPAFVEDEVSGPGGIKPFIKADHRLNAIVIGDTQANVDTYGELIKSLDVPLDQIEVNVTMVNIQTDDLSRLGVDWQYTSNDYAVNVGDISATGALATGELQLIAGAAGNLVSKIRALATEGKAKITSQPSVLTLDNYEAVLDNSNTFYVRISGEDVVDLFPVTVGTLVRVTPHIQRTFNGEEVRLDIQIEDGQQTEQSVDGIPVVTNTLINTQAVIGKNQSLLIGGYYYDSQGESVSQVPLLHRIPLLGNLFKSTSKTSVKMLRLFLISPHVVQASDMATDEQGAQLNTPSNFKLIK